MKASTFSIFMPVWNRAKTLCRALDSIVGQGFDEIVVIDDASTDGSFEIASSYPQVKVVRHARKSDDHLLALEPIVESLTGDYLVGCASDDVYYPTMLAELRSAADSAERKPGVIFCGYDFITPEGETLSSVRYADIDYVPPELVKCVLDGTEIGCGSAIRRDLYLWLQQLGIHSLGAYSDSVGYALAALKAGASYRATPVVGFTVWGNRENYWKRQLDDPATLQKLRDAAERLLAKSEVKPLTEQAKFQTPLLPTRRDQYMVGPRFRHAAAAKLLGGIGKHVALLFSTEFDGLYRNGGIGTYYRQLAKALRAESWFVVFINAGSPVVHDDPVTIDLDAIMDVSQFSHEINCDNGTKALLDSPGHTWFEQTSLKCLAYTRAAVRLFSGQKIYAEFHEMSGIGYATAKASESGLLGESCVVGVTMHSGHEWIYETNRAISTQPNDYFGKVSAQEENSFAAADLAMFPSDSLHDIVKSYGWRLDHACRLPYPVPSI